MNGNPLFVKMIDEFVIPIPPDFAQRHCMVLELAENGSTLEHLIQSRKEQNRLFSQEEVINIIVNIMVALKDFHDKGFQHRNLKPSNILAFEQAGSTPLLKLADFGLTKFQNETIMTSTTSITGTLYFNSPERFQGNSKSDKEDVWALGVLTYYLCTLTLPFRGP